jgi:hypothetical protein
MNNRIKIILAIIVLTATLVAAHDLFPYSQYNYELQTINISEQYEISSDTLLHIWMNLSEHVRPAPYETVMTEVLGFNVTHISFTTDVSENISLVAIGLVGIRHIPFEISNIDAGDYLSFYVHMDTNTTIIGTIFFNLTYTADLFYQKPERPLIYESIFDMILSFDMRVPLFILVILIGISLSYISLKISYY